MMKFHLCGGLSTSFYPQLKMVPPLFWKTEEISISNRIGDRHGLQRPIRSSMTFMPYTCSNFSVLDSLAGFLIYYSNDEVLLPGRDTLTPLMNDSMLPYHLCWQNTNIYGHAISRLGVSIIG